MTETLLNLVLTLCALAVFGSLALSVYCAIEVRRQGRVLGQAVTAIRTAVGVVAAQKPELVPTVNRLRAMEVSKDVAVPRPKTNGKSKVLRSMTEDEEWACWAVKHPDEVADPSDLQKAHEIHAELMLTREV